MSLRDEARLHSKVFLNYRAHERFSVDDAIRR
jgi:hypothetical protein